MLECKPNVPYVGYVGNVCAPYKDTSLVMKCGSHTLAFYKTCSWSEPETSQNKPISNIAL